MQPHLQQTVVCHGIGYQLAQQVPTIPYVHHPQPQAAAGPRPEVFYLLPVTTQQPTYAAPRALSPYLPWPISAVPVHTPMAILHEQALALQHHPAAPIAMSLPTPLARRQFTEGAHSAALASEAGKAALGSVCRHILSGRCNRRKCRFIHSIESGPCSNLDGSAGLSVLTTENASMCDSPSVTDSNPDLAFVMASLNLPEVDSAVSA